MILRTNIMYYFVIYIGITTSNTNVFTPPQEQIISVLQYPQ